MEFWDLVDLEYQCWKDEQTERKYKNAENKERTGADQESR